MEQGAESSKPATDPAADARFADMQDAKPWLDAITAAEKAFQSYQEKCDSIEKLYSNLEEKAKLKTDREFQMFWANLEVIKPSIYARAPQPVVVPRFKDLRELPRAASEILERTLSTNFDLDNVHEALKEVRDDLAITGRGCAWARYEVYNYDDGGAEEKVCYDHIDRKDFLHEPARKWKEVGWVGRRSFLSRDEAIKRFATDPETQEIDKGKLSLVTSMEYREYKPDDGASYDAEKKAAVWELWSKSKRLVVWVSKGVESVLDIQEPFLSLDGFFPCPKPAYGTLQRGTLIPVPDYVYYRDQIEEINELTGRIAGLANSLRMKGFYANGEEGVTGAIEKALKTQDNSAILVPVAAHLIAGGSLKDSVLWLPVQEVAITIKELVALRKEIISDVYQITGISDIMRGDTEASETLGAQQLKSQYGSIRIKERQAEMVRVARDLTRIGAEIIAENFQPQTLLTMSQMDMATEAANQQQMAQIQQQYQSAALQAKMSGQPVPPPPQPKLPVTIEQVVNLLRQERTRPCVIDIETDSTITPDENAEKQRRTEFVTAIGGFIQQAFPLVQAMPQAAPLATETLKFVAAGFRAGRQLEGAIEEFADNVKQIASQPKPPNPEVEKMKHEAAMEERRMAGEERKSQAEIAIKGEELKLKQMDLRLKEIELQLKGQESQMKGRELELKDRELSKPEPGPDSLEEEDRMLKVEHSKVDLEGKKRQLENEGRKTEADATDSEQRAQHSTAINEVSQKLVAAIDKLDQRQDKSEEVLATLVKAISAPKRAVRGPDGRVMGVETVMN
jgi:hypothetical protein